MKRMRQVAKLFGFVFFSCQVKHDLRHNNSKRNATIGFPRGVLIPEQFV
jgi:hypothetical protein